MVVGLAITFAPSAAAHEHGLYCEEEEHYYGEEWTCYGVVNPEDGEVCTQEDGSESDYPGEEPHSEKSGWCVIDSAPGSPDIIADIAKPASQNSDILADSEAPDNPLMGRGVACETDQETDGSDTETEKDCVVAITEDDGVCVLYEYTYESYVDEDGERHRNENTNCFEP